jgi:outer membrane protein OmpA-like peptidoglycan-associated protein
MRKSALPTLAIVLAMPIIVVTGCAWQSDFKMLQQEVKNQRSYIDRVDADASLGSKRALDMATAALKNTEQVAQAAQKSAEAAALEFGFNKSRVNLTMGRQLDAILGDLKGRKVSFQVVGHADTVGPKKANMILAQKRANEVRAALLRRGVSPSLVNARAVGEEAPLVQTKDGERLRANRAVILTIRDRAI